MSSWGSGILDQVLKIFWDAHGTAGQTLHIAEVAEQHFFPPLKFDFSS